MQYLLDLEMDPVEQFAIDVKLLQKSVESTRMCLFARNHGLEKRVIETEERMRKLEIELAHLKMIQGI